MCGSNRSVRSGILAGFQSFLSVEEFLGVRSLSGAASCLLRCLAKQLQVVLLIKRTFVCVCGRGNHKFSAGCTLDMCFNLASMFHFSLCFVSAFNLRFNFVYAINLFCFQFAFNLVFHNFLLFIMSFINFNINLF